jgi:hypothetical protein
MAAPKVTLNVKADEIPDTEDLLQFIARVTSIGADPVEERQLREGERIRETFREAQTGAPSERLEQIRAETAAQPTSEERFGPGFLGILKQMLSSPFRALSPENLAATTVPSADLQRARTLTGAQTELRRVLPGGAFEQEQLGNVLDEVARDRLATTPVDKFGRSALGRSLGVEDVVSQGELDDRIKLEQLVNQSRTASASLINARRQRLVVDKSFPMTHPETGVEGTTVAVIDPINGAVIKRFFDDDSTIFAPRQEQVISVRTDPKTGESITEISRGPAAKGDVRAAVARRAKFRERLGKDRKLLQRIARAQEVLATGPSFGAGTGGARGLRTLNSIKAQLATFGAVALPKGLTKSFIDSAARTGDNKEVAGIVQRDAVLTSLAELIAVALATREGQGRLTKTLIDRALKMISGFNTGDTATIQAVLSNLSNQIRDDVMLEGRDLDPTGELGLGTDPVQFLNPEMRRFFSPIRSITSLDQIEEGEVVNLRDFPTRSGSDATDAALEGVVQRLLNEEAGPARTVEGVAPTFEELLRELERDRVQGGLP